MYPVSSTVWFAAFTCLLALVLLNFYFMNRLLKMLREKHSLVWTNLGSPTLFLNNSIKNGWATLRFIYKKEYTRLADPMISKLCRTVFILHMISYATFALLLISSLAFGTPAPEEQPS